MKKRCKKRSKNTHAFSRVSYLLQNWAISVFPFARSHNSCNHNGKTLYTKKMQPKTPFFLIFRKYEIIMEVSFAVQSPLFKKIVIFFFFLRFTFF